MGESRVAELIGELSAQWPRVLVALDFDGTLAPLVSDPADSRPLPGLVEVLVRLAGAGAQIAVITGRDARTVLNLGRLERVPDIEIVGIYGMETWRGGKMHTPDEPDEIGELRRRLPAAIADADPGVWTEDKRLSLVVHTRPARDPDAALAALQQPVRALAGELGLEVHDGKQVLEIRTPGFDKGAALRQLVERDRPDAVLYAGDDAGDLPALHVIRDLRADARIAWSVVADSNEVPEDVRAAADVVVDGPAGVLALLQRLPQRGATSQPSASS